MPPVRYTCAALNLGRVRLRDRQSARNVNRSERLQPRHDSPFIDFGREPRWKLRRIPTRNRLNILPMCFRPLLVGLRTVGRLTSLGQDFRKSLRRVLVGAFSTEIKSFSERPPATSASTRSLWHVPARAGLVEKRRSTTALRDRCPVLEVDGIRA